MSKIGIQFVLIKYETYDKKEMHKIQWIQNSGQAYWVKCLDLFRVERKLMSKKDS